MADDWSQQSKLAPQDGDSDDWFGRSVALDGDTALVGAVQDEDPSGDFAGSAYVFSKSGDNWSQQAKLTPDDGDKDDSFGVAVALNGDTALVGANRDEDPKGDSAGSTYVFSKSGGDWTQQTKLTPQDRKELFGSSVALDGDTALIGAAADNDPNGTSTGSAYVFTRSNGKWSQQAKLIAQDSDEFERFGVSVAVNGDTALIGTFGDNNPNDGSAGSAYVFSKHGDNWSQQAKLAPQDGDRSDAFGEEVALDGDTAFIGAYFDKNQNGTNTGSVYVFSKSGGGWNQQTKLAAQDGDRDDRFGGEVALDGETALIGTFADEDPNGGAAGSAYVFSKGDGNWGQQTKLTPQDGDRKDIFGWSVALDGRTALIGARYDEDPNGEKAGSAYVFSKNGQQQAAFDVTIDSTNAPVIAGNRLDVVATITNTGDQSARKPVTLSVGDTQRDTTTLSLDSGQSQRVTLSWQTADGDSGSYTAEVATPSNSATTSVTISQGGTSLVDQYDQNGDGSIDIAELGQAAADFAQGNLSIAGLGRIAATFAGS